MIRLSAIATLFFIFTGFTSLASGWETLKTDHFTIFYKPEYEENAWEFLRVLEYYRPEVEKLTGNKTYHLPTVLIDGGTMSNGMADPFYYRMFLYNYPPSAGVLGNSLENWPTVVGVHEYTHILHLAKTGGLFQGLKVLFGNGFSPNLYSLGWVIEGITVYEESQISRYQGRLNDGYYDAYIGARVRDKRFPSILSAAYPPLEYPYYGGIHLYGGVFFDFLAKTYGEESFTRFFEEYGSSLPIFTFGRSAKRVYGKSFPRLWKEWEQYESERFKDFNMEGERVTQHGWYISDLMFQEKKLYYARSYPVKTGAFKGYSFNKIVERDIKTGKEKFIVTTTSFFTAPFKIQNGKLYYSVAEVKPGYPNPPMLNYGFFSVIHERDLESGDDRVLLRKGMRDFEILEDGNLIYSIDRKQGFGSDILLYDRNSREKRLLINSDYLIDEIVRNENKIIVSARKDFENFSLYELDLEKQILKPLVDTPYFEGFHSLRDDKLFFTANYGELYSSYFYDFSSDIIYRLTANGYSSYPVYDENEKILYYVGLNSYGFDIYSRHIELREFQLPGEVPSLPPGFSLDERYVRKGGYWDNVKTLVPGLRLPIFSFSEGKTRTGVFLMGQDALGHFPYATQILYDFQSKAPVYDISLTTTLLAPFKATVSSSNLEEERELAVDMLYPVVTRLSPGLSDFSSGLSGRFFQNFERRELTPYLLLGFRFPFTNLGLNISLPLEREGLGSAIDRTAFSVDLNLGQYIKNSELNLDIAGIYDPNTTYNPEKDPPEESPFPIIRGYEKPLDAKTGTALSFDLTAPLLRIRWGPWFPPYLFFEDLNGAIFIDGAFSKIIESPQLSTGVEFHIETKVVTNIPLDMGLRFVVNREGEFKVQPFLSLGMVF